MIDYVTILGCTYYLMLYPDAIELEVKRIGMHLKNICFYSNNSKNPINAIIVSLESLKKMGASKVRDIADCKLPEISINFINLLAELKNRLKISIFLWRKSCASR